MAVRRYRRTIKSSFSGRTLTHTPHPKTKRHVYADDEEDHRLHSHLIGMDYHKKGRGGIGNKSLVQKWKEALAKAKAQKRVFRSEAAKKNAPPDPHGRYKNRSHRFIDGAVDKVEQTAYKRQMNFNLDNNDDVAQGSQGTAMPTSISSLISGQLRQAANAPIDYAEIRNMSIGNTNSPFSFAMNGFNGSATQLAQSNPFGAFGTNKIMYGPEEDEMYGDDTQEMVEDGTFGGWGMSGVITMFNNTAERDAWYLGDPGAEKFSQDLGAKWNEWTKTHDATQASADTIFNNPMRARYAQWFNNQQKNPQNIMDPTGKVGWVANPNYKDPNAPAPAPGTHDDDGDPTTSNGSQIKPLDMREDPASPTPTGMPGSYNPWAYGKGGEENSYGPSQAQMNQSTMEAMALANAYFAPQRTELAYELGDMETDMRRLAVNLGRQVDDPVLQAKLYKEGMRAVRTLDTQQNTFAFQMVDARRKEENANFQFYDSLAQQEYQLWLANKQATDNWNLAANSFNLNNWIAMENARNASTAQNSPPATEGMEYNYGSAKSVVGGTKLSSGIYSRTRY